MVNGRHDCHLAWNLQRLLRTAATNAARFKTNTTGEDMTFSVCLASNEKPRLPARPDADVEKTSNYFSEFCQGISFGVGLLLAIVIAYWVITAAAGGLPNLQWFQMHWLSVR